MSLFWRAKPRAPEARSFVAPFIPYVRSDDSYADVDLSTAESSLQSVAVRAAVDLIASLSSELPVEVYSGTGTERRKRPLPGYLEDPAGDGYGLPDWVYQVLESWLLRGNLFGDILDQTPAGVMRQVALHHPDRVSARIEGGKVRWAVDGKSVDDPSRFLHRRVNPVPGQVYGLSPVRFHAAQVGLSLRATRFGEQWFRDGAHPGGMLVNEEVNLDKDQADTAKSRFLAALRGTREPVVLGKGWKYQQIQVSPEESQFLATQQYTEAQCARIFGPGIAEVLGYESGGSLTYANVESRMNHLLVLALNKWLTRIERLLTEMLPRPQYARLNREALLQSTALDRFRAHELALKNQWRTVNEVRAIEDLPPVEWGDQPNQLGAQPGGPEAPQPKEGDDQ